MRWRGGGRGGHGGRGVQPGQIARLVEPCILALLKERPQHGYELIDSMMRFGLDPQLIDSGLVYRTLRQMEADGWVASAWQTAASGPYRRVYELTETGRAALAAWGAELARTHDVLHRLLAAIEG